MKLSHNEIIQREGHRLGRKSFYWYSVTEPDSWRKPLYKAELEEGMEKIVPVKFLLWGKCQIEHEEEKQQNLKPGACPDEMLWGSPAAYPSQMWCRKGGDVLSSFDPELPTHMSPYVNIKQTICKSLPDWLPAPKCLGFGQLIFYIHQSLWCLRWTQCNVFRINMIIIIRTGNSGMRKARASQLATGMYYLSGSTLISGHLGYAHRLFSAGSNVPFCLPLF